MPEKNRNPKSLAGDFATFNSPVLYKNPNPPPVTLDNVVGYNTYLDVSDVSIKGNYSAKEIQDLASQKSDFTQAFTLPFTQVNNDFFSHFAIKNLIFKIMKILLSEV